MNGATLSSFGFSPGAIAASGGNTGAAGVGGATTVVRTRGSDFGSVSEAAALEYSFGALFLTHFATVA